MKTYTMRIGKIFKYGHSLAVIFNPSIGKALSLKHGDYMVVQVFGQDLVFTKLELTPGVRRQIMDKKQRLYESLSKIKGNEDN